MTKVIAYIPFASKCKDNKRVQMKGHEAALQFLILLKRDLHDGDVPNFELVLPSGLQAVDRHIKEQESRLFALRRGSVPSWDCLR